MRDRHASGHALLNDPVLIGVVTLSIKCGWQPEQTVHCEHIHTTVLPDFF